MKVVSTNPEAKTATVQIHGQTRELKASFYPDHVTVYGIAIRYPTGSKIWHGSFIYWFATGNINNIHTPMDSHAGRLSCHVNVVGFYEDVPQDYRSKRAGR